MNLKTAAIVKSPILQSAIIAEYLSCKSWVFNIPNSGPREIGSHFKIVTFMPFLKWLII